METHISQIRGFSPEIGPTITPTPTPHSGKISLHKYLFILANVSFINFLTSTKPNGNKD
jgi:hypothetical protein